MYKSFLITGLVIFVAGCSGQRATTTTEASSQDPDQFPPRYSRTVAPFEIRDANGQPYELPFLGGLNVPRPQFVDIDGDGDGDLFLQEITGELKFFEHERTTEGSKFIWRSDKYNDIEIGEWRPVLRYGR